MFLNTLNLKLCISNLNFRKVVFLIMRPKLIKVTFVYSLVGTLPVNGICFGPLGGRSREIRLHFTYGKTFSNIIYKSLALYRNVRLFPICENMSFKLRLNNCPALVIQY